CRESDLRRDRSGDPPLPPLLARRDRGEAPRGRPRGGASLVLQHARRPRVVAERGPLAASFGARPPGQAERLARAVAPPRARVRAARGDVAPRGGTAGNRRALKQRAPEATLPRPGLLHAVVGLSRGDRRTGRGRPGSASRRASSWWGSRRGRCPGWRASWP